MRSLSGIARVSILSVWALGAMLAPGRAETVTLDFTLTVESERVIVRDVVPTGAGGETVPDWAGLVDPALFGAADDYALFGLYDVGDVLSGRLSYTDPFDFSLSLDDTAIRIGEFGRIGATDAAGNAEYLFSSSSLVSAFDFTTGRGVVTTDRSETRLTPDGSYVVHVTGYASIFTLSGYDGAPAREVAAPGEALAVMPLPAGPALVLTGLGALMLVRQAQRGQRTA